jgi:hypothetical protein
MMVREFVRRAHCPPLIFRLTGAVFFSIAIFLIQKGSSIASKQVDIHETMELIGNLKGQLQRLERENDNLMKENSKLIMNDKTLQRKMDDQKKQIGINGGNETSAAKGEKEPNDSDVKLKKENTKMIINDKTLQRKMDDQKKQTGINRENKTSAAKSEKESNDSDVKLKKENIRRRPQVAEETMNDERCALCFFGLPRAYKDMVLPSIVKNVLIPNAHHNCDVYVHFYHQHEEKSGRGNRGGPMDPDEILLLEQAAKDVQKEHGSGRSNDRIPHVAYTNDTEAQFLERRGELLKKYHETVGPKGKRAYFPWKALTYRNNSSLENIVKQWHSIDDVFKLMDVSARVLDVTYSRVGMFQAFRECQ